MSEALRQAVPLTPAVPAVLADAMPIPLPVQSNDNDVATAPRTGESVGFEIPPSIWYAMVACYVVFLGALLAATGGARAAFAIAISAAYVAMFFGTARALVRQAPAQPRSPLAPWNGRLQTIYGPLGRTEVVAQMITVPLTVAMFGLAVLAIRLAVF